MPRTWTDQQRKAQAERCRAQKPWKNSTGPKTAEGKARSSLNGLKHGNRCAVRERYSRLLRLNREFMKEALLIGKMQHAVFDRIRHKRTDNQEDE